MLVGVRAEQLTLHNRADYRPYATWGDELFTCLFGPTGNHITTATDTSPIHAPISFHGAAEIRDASSIHISGTTGTPNWPSAAICPSDGSYIEVPHNAAYDTLGNNIAKGFTIEFSFVDGVYNPNSPSQWIGVWDGPLLANQSWRFMVEPTTWRFQWIERGVMRQISMIVGSANPSLWVKPIIDHYGGELRVMLQWGNGMNDLTQDFFGGPVLLSNPIDPPANPVPLRIGGTPDRACMNFIRGVRITNASQYHGILPAFVSSPFGYVFPPIVIDTDTIYQNRVGQVLAPTVVDTDVFYPPVLKQDAVLRPPFLVDADHFHVVGLPPNFSPDSCCQGPIPPNVRDETIGPPYPVFEDETITTGSGTTATLTLPSTRNTDDLLWVIIQFDQPILGGQIAGGLDMTNGRGTGGGGGGFPDPGWWFWNPSDAFCQTNVVSGFPNLGDVISARSEYIVDGNEPAPTFTLPVSCNWIGRILRFSNVDVSFSFPFWDYSVMHAPTSVNQRMQSSQAWFLPPGNYAYSDCFWGGDPNTCALYVKLMMVTTDLVLADQFAYRNISKHNSSNGSVLVSVHNASQSEGASDNWGSGYIDEALGPITGYTTNWEADVFVINAPFP